MQDFAENLIKIIKKDNIKPLPRWFFVIKNACFYLSVVVGIALSSIAVATITHVLASNDWDIYHELVFNVSDYILTTIPYAWSAIAISFLLSAYFLFRRTRNGYRYRFASVLGTGILASSLLGSALYAAGVGEQVDEYIRNNSPVYHRILNPQVKLWQQPEAGRLAGDVVEIRDDSITVRDESGFLWQIENALPDQNTLSLFSSTNTPHRIKILGEKNGQNIFKARIISIDKISKNTKKLPVSIKRNLKDKDNQKINTNKKGNKAKNESEDKKTFFEKASISKRRRSTSKTIHFNGEQEVKIFK